MRGVGLDHYLDWCCECRAWTLHNCEPPVECNHCTTADAEFWRCPFCQGGNWRVAPRRAEVVRRFCLTCTDKENAAAFDYPLFTGQPWCAVGRRINGSLVE